MTAQFVDAQVIDTIWRFDAQMTSPEGVHVSVQIEVPERLAGPDLPELGEHAAMLAAGGIGRVLSALRSSTSRAGKGGY